MAIPVFRTWLAGTFNYVTDRTRLAIQSLDSAQFYGLYGADLGRPMKINNKPHKPASAAKV